MSETLPGTWYDGRSSRGRPVRLSCPAPGRLRLVDEDGGQHEFDIATLSLGAPLGDLPRRLSLPGEGHVELADSPLLAAWLPRRHRLEVAVHWLERRKAAALASAVSLVVGVVAFFEVGLPWMAAEVAPIVPPAMERTISRQAMALLDSSQLRPSRLPSLRREQLREAFHGLTRGLPRQDGLRLAFRDAPTLGPNAFALPDGQIVMTDQLVALAQDDEELLAVLAHEAGHHEHRHGMRRALEGSAVVVVAGFLFGDVSGTGSLSVSLPVLLLESGFSRRHEREADDFAFGLLARKGHSPEAFARIMGRLSNAVGERKLPVVGYLSTHPPSDERIEAAKRAAGSGGDALDPRE